MAPKLSIVIVNWNSKDYLRKCLASIDQHASELKPQIIVVDGASFDGCEKMLSTEFPSVTFIQSGENIGFGRCNNLGAQQADGERLLLLNPDTEIEPDALQNLLTTHEALGPNAMLGARLLNTDGSLQTTSVHAAPTPLNQALGSEFLMKLFPKSSLWGTYEAYHSNTPTSVEAISGACMLLSTSLFQKVVGFTSSYFMYAEDMDLCLKIRRVGGSVNYCPSAAITHHGGASSSAQYSQFSTIKLRESVYHYMLLNHGIIVAQRYKFTQSLSAIFRLPIVFVYSMHNNAPLKKWATVLSWAFSSTPHYVSNTSIY